MRDFCFCESRVRLGVGVGVAVVFTGPGVIAPFLQIGRSHDALGNRPILQTMTPLFTFFP